MSGKSVKLDTASDALLADVKKQAGLPRAEALKKAVHFWAPRVLAGQISVVDPKDGQKDLPLAVAGGDR